MNLLFTLAALVMVACGQTPEEKVKAYEEAHDGMMKEYRQMRQRQRHITMISWRNTSLSISMRRRKTLTMKLLCRFS